MSVATPESRVGPSQTREEVFRLLVDAVSDYAIFVLDVTGRIRTWNAGAERIKQYSADEIIGRHFSVFYTDDDKAVGRPDTILDTARRDGRAQDEGWRVRKDGTRFWADVTVTALHQPDGSLYGFAKVTRDSTERRAAEQRERELAVEQQARLAAEEALRARDHFLSIASHELKTPVASLQLAAESLVRGQEAETLSGERLATGLRRIHGAVLRLGSLVNELLDVSLLTSRSIPVEVTPIDLVEVARDAVATFVDAAPHGRIRLAVPDSIPLVGDPMRISQVLINLVDNALKYSGDLTAVEVRATAVEDGAVIEVVDHGVGLDPVARRELFEPFGRGGNTSHIPGMGLGLYISRQIVERHGGSIRASSDGGDHGTTITVWLPRRPVPATTDGAISDGALTYDPGLTPDG
jgi:PAS domain S-box-containing protein